MTVLTGQEWSVEKHGVTTRPLSQRRFWVVEKDVCEIAGVVVDGILFYFIFFSRLPRRKRDVKGSCARLASTASPNVV